MKPSLLHPAVVPSAGPVPMTAQLRDTLDSLREPPTRGQIPVAHATSSGSVGSRQLPGSLPGGETFVRQDEGPPALPAEATACPTGRSAPTGGSTSGGEEKPSEVTVTGCCCCGCGCQQEFGAADGPRKTIRAVHTADVERATAQGGSSPSRENQAEAEAATVANRAPSAASEFDEPYCPRCMWPQRLCVCESPLEMDSD